MISFKQVEKSLAGKKILEGVNFTLEAQDKIVLVGANGCGKSTFCKLFMDILTPDQGEIIRPENWRKITGYMPSGGDGFFPELSGLENLLFYASFWQLPPQDVEAIIERYSFDRSFITRPIRVYSQGMLQKLSFMRATMHAPKILVLDEPSVFIDADFQIELLNYLRKFQGALLLTTHHQSLHDGLGVKCVKWGEWNAA